MIMAIFSLNYLFYNIFVVFFCFLFFKFKPIIMLLFCVLCSAGGYYTIDQTKSRLRIIALNTNYMRHDIKYSQTHSQPVRQRPGSMDSSEYTNSHYHHNNHYRSSSSGISNNNGGGGGGGSSNSGQNNGNNNSGGTVSALSGGESHESQKQWEWLEDVLAKSSRNKETVCFVYFLNFFVYIVNIENIFFCCCVDSIFL